MKALTLLDAALLARALPGWLDREHELLGALERLGVDESELRVLLADEQLLRILAEEAEDLSAEASRGELQRVLAWHRERLRRVAGRVLQPDAG